MLDIVCLIFGVLGISYGIGCYWELRKWARQCQGARIAIAFKRKVQLQAPLVEFVHWCNQLDKDKNSHGRVIYRNGGVTVAISKATHAPGRWQKLTRRKSENSVKEGRAEMASENAPKTGKTNTTQTEVTA